MKQHFFILLLILVLVAGCVKNNPSNATGGTPIADEKADNILNGINKEDYSIFNRDLSDTVKQSMDEESFSRLSKFIKENSGDYVVKTLAASKDENNMHTLSYDCQFSLESVFFTITFNEDYSIVEGIYFDSENMRNALNQNIDFAK